MPTLCFQGLPCRGNGNHAGRLPLSGGGNSHVYAAWVSCIGRALNPGHTIISDPTENFFFFSGPITTANFYAVSADLPCRMGMQLIFKFISGLSANFVLPVLLTIFSAGAGHNRWWNGYTAGADVGSISQEFFRITKKQNLRLGRLAFGGDVFVSRHQRFLRELPVLIARF